MVLLLPALLILFLIVTFSYYWKRAGDVMEASTIVSRVELLASRAPLSNAEGAINNALFNGQRSQEDRLCSEIEAFFRSENYSSGPSLDLTRLVFAERETPKIVRSRVEQTFVACRLEATYGPNTLLRAYLSQAYFGNGEFGIEVASNSIFGKSPDDLSADDGFALAALLWLPSLRNSPDQWAEKQKKLRDRAILARK